MTETTWRKRAGIMLCYPFEEKRLTKWKPPYLVQPKLDGERCRAVSLNGSAVLLSSEENIIFSVPHINEAVNELNTNLELDGELYCHGMPFEEIHSRVGRTVNRHEDYKSIEFHVFDVVTEEPQFKRIGVLYKLDFQSPLQHVASIICDSFEDIMRAYDRIIALGYEGIVVRHIDAPYVRRRSLFLMKFKPKKQDVYEIVGWKEEISKDGIPKNRLGALVCKGDDGTEFSVGTGLNDDLRNSLWKERTELIGLNCRVQYQHITSGAHVPRFPVFVEVLP